MADEKESAAAVETESQVTEHASGGSEENQNSGEDKRFTQAELDAKIAERLEREREKQKREREEAEREAEEKRLAEQNEFKTLAEKRAAEIEALKERSRKQAIRHAVTLAATAAAFHDPQDAFALADLSGVEVDEDGKVTGVREALAALAEAKPHLIKKDGGRVPDAPGGSNGRRMTTEETNKRRREFARSVKNW